jgi:hypothetical protein
MTNAADLVEVGLRAGAQAAHERCERVRLGSILCL